MFRGEIKIKFAGLRLEKELMSRRVRESCSLSSFLINKEKEEMMEQKKKYFVYNHY